MQQVMQQWEYMQKACPPQNLVPACNMVGTDGWEAVAVLPITMQANVAIAVNGQEAGPQPALLVLFKRPKQNVTNPNRIAQA